MNLNGDKQSRARVAAVDLDGGGGWGLGAGSSVRQQPHHAAPPIGKQLFPHRRHDQLADVGQEDRNPTMRTCHMERKEL